MVMDGQHPSVTASDADRGCEGTLGFKALIDGVCNASFAAVTGEDCIFTGGVVHFDLTAVGANGTSYGILHGYTS